MNIDRLLKLLKLANHNSNDAEANSAARAACKMLSGDNYKWIENIKGNGNSTIRGFGTPDSSSDPLEDLFRDIFGSRGGNWGSWANPPHTPPRTEPPPKPPPYRREPTNWTWTGKEDERGNIKYSKVYKEVLRDCTMCKITRLTADETTPYVCAECKRKRDKPPFYDF